MQVKRRNENEEKLGLLLGFAFPERIGKKQGERYQLAGGQIAVLPKGSLLTRRQYLAIGEVDGAGIEVKAFLAAPLDEGDIEKVGTERIVVEEQVRWDDADKMVVARSLRRFGAIILLEKKLDSLSDRVRLTMLEGVHRMGLECLPWTKSAASLRTQSEWLRVNKFVSDDFPSLSDEHLLNSLNEWLGPHLHGITKHSQLEELELLTILGELFTYKQLKELDRLAPSHLTVPTGSRIPTEYGGSQPVLAVRLQEMFGETDTPRIAEGKAKVLIHLLSPAHRTIAVTQDLASFWKHAYPDVRKEMRGQYPKHYWPDNPVEAQPTKRTKRK